jgi:hypothetical protein
MENLSIDFDCVLYDLSTITNNFIKNHYGEVTHPDLIGWDYFNENFPLVVKECWNNPEEYSKGKFIVGAIEFMNELINLYGVDKLQIVTNSLPNVIDYKNQLIRETFSDIDVIHTKEKWKYTKGTILIDDAIHNIEEHCNKNKSLGIIFDLDGKYTWNHKSIDSSHVMRVKSYNEIIDYLRWN